MKTYKLVLIGEINVGKTSLISRFKFDCFDTLYKATVGIDFVTKTVELDDRKMLLHLWDTAGQERFRSLIPAFIRSSHAAIVVYDVTNMNSFIETTRWIRDVRMERGDNAIIILVGNRVDLEENRTVSTELGERKAKELNVMFIETSAKTGDNVQELFRLVVEKLPDIDSLSSENSSIDGWNHQVTTLSDTRTNTTNDSGTERRGCACWK